MLDHVTGRTISAEVRTGIFDLLKNTSARIINEATGVAFIRETAGFEKSLKRLLLYDKAAPKAPANVPIINPASILKSENLDEWILACTNEAELKEIVGGALMHPLLQQHTQLIEQAFHAYERGSYALSILGMLAAIDALLSGVSGMINSTGMKQRINSIFDKLNQKRTVTKREMKDLCVGFTTAETLKRLKKTNNFDESEPENINRHWLMHGRSRREISRLDCIKMLRLINGILLVHELADAKLDE